MKKIHLAASRADATHALVIDTDRPAFGGDGPLFGVASESLDQLQAGVLHGWVGWAPEPTQTPCEPWVIDDDEVARWVADNNNDPDGWVAAVRVEDLTDNLLDELGAPGKGYLWVRAEGGS